MKCWAVFKKIYTKKLDVLKIRIHGYYTLSQVLLTGKDIAIQGYGGDPLRSFQRKKIKKIADCTMWLPCCDRFTIRVYEGFHVNHHHTKREYA